MGREVTVRPSAAALSESMRDIGYTLDTAIADLVDNSISAGADTVQIYGLPHSSGLLAVIDNGSGMTEEEIVAAMRHGGLRKDGPRRENDLGKFGLGLKTASFSQCRQLTVVSRKRGVLSAAEWDLDVVGHRDDWVVSVLDRQEISQLPLVDELKGTGTLVLWRKLDRLTGKSRAEKHHEIINEKLKGIEKHLALVFHRFLNGEVKWHSSFNLSVNGHKVEPLDPYCLDNKATQMLPTESIDMGQHRVVLQGYILPHHSKLSAQEYDFYKERSDFMQNQGGYVYRNCRLVAWGGWFRLAQKNEAMKHARVKFDFPSVLDSQWKTDIKKSSVELPKIVRRRLKQLLKDITERSTRIYTGRGEKLFSEKKYPIWKRVVNRSGIRYMISDTHPLVQWMIKNSSKARKRKLKLILRIIEAELPTEMIYADWTAKPKKMNDSAIERADLVGKLNLLRDCWPKQQHIDPGKFRDLVRATRLFENDWDTVEKYITQQFCNNVRSK